MYDAVKCKWDQYFGINKWTHAYFPTSFSLSLSYTLTSAHCECSCGVAAHCLVSLAICDVKDLSCGDLWCVAVWCSALRCVAVCCSVLPCVAVCCSVLQCVAVRCSVLQFVAVCCIVSLVATCCINRALSLSLSLFRSFVFPRCRRVGCSEL